LNYTRIVTLFTQPRGFLARSGVASRAMRGALLRPPRAPTARTWEAFVLPLNYTRI